MIPKDQDVPSVSLTNELSALRQELSRQRTAAAFAEYVTLKDLNAVFGVSDQTMKRWKIAGLRPVNTGLKSEIFRVQDVKDIWERPETPIPNRRKKRQPR